MKKTVESKRLGESYLRVEHPSGLTMLLCPMKGFSTAYAMFGTKYGSVDTTFKTDADVPYPLVKVIKSVVKPIKPLLGTV